MLDIKAVLEAHGKWARGEVGGKRADLYGADLSGADLYGANLYGANLSRANLSRANLSRANLSRANLSRANLYGADLSGADLSRANLSRANLSRANLYGADLYGADLYGADLYGADLSRANLYGADLSGAEGVDAGTILRRSIVPQEGAFRAYKKVWLATENGYKSGVAVLEIPEDAKRLGGVLGRKCRASSALVLGFLTPEKEPAIDIEGRSQHDEEFIYRTGEVVTPSNGFEENALIECAAGIHFFLSFEEAAEY